MSLITATLTGFFVVGMAGGAMPFSAPISDVSNTEQPITYSVSMTAYNAVHSQTDGDPFTTASGAYSNPEIVVARSQDLADKLPFGTIISISYSGDETNCGANMVENLIGYRVIADSMNKRMRNKIDILFDMNDEVVINNKLTNPARVMGVCQDVKISVVGYVNINKIPKTQSELQKLISKSRQFTSHLSRANI